jgi:hypothetical protein
MTASNPETLNKRREPTRLAPPVHSCASGRAAQAQRWAHRHQITTVVLC